MNTTNYSSAQCAFSEVLPAAKCFASIYIIYISRCGPVLELVCFVM